MISKGNYHHLSIPGLNNFLPKTSRIDLEEPGIEHHPSQTVV